MVQSTIPYLGFLVNWVLTGNFFTVSSPSYIYSSNYCNTLGMTLNSRDCQLLLQPTIKRILYAFPFIVTQNLLKDRHPDSMTKIVN